MEPIKIRLENSQHPKDHMDIGHSHSPNLRPSTNGPPSDQSYTSQIATDSPGQSVCEEKSKQVFDWSRYELSNEEIAVKIENDDATRSITCGQKSKDEIDAMRYKDIDELTDYFKPFKRLSGSVYPFGHLSELPDAIKKKWVDEIKFNHKDGKETLCKEYHKIIKKFIENSSKDEVNEKHFKILEKILNAFHLKTNYFETTKPSEVEKVKQDFTSTRQTRPEQFKSESKSTTKSTAKINTMEKNVSSKEMFSEGTIRTQERQMADDKKSEKGFESDGNGLQRQIGDFKM